MFSSSCGVRKTKKALTATQQIKIHRRIFSFLLQPTGTTLSTCYNMHTEGLAAQKFLFLSFTSIHHEVLTLKINLVGG